MVRQLFKKKEKIEPLRHKAHEVTALGLGGLTL
jgi:hypothetical protein